MIRLTSALLLVAYAAYPAAAAERPNIIFIFADDLGYADLSCYGNKRFQTPHLDQLSSEGVRLTQFYVPSPACTPSRAALLTGRYPTRSGLAKVLFPQSKVGLPAEEFTVAEALKEAGYATACIGKWHLGHLPQFLPTNHGFDEYFGLPYSNDMTVAKRKDPPLPLMRGTEIIETSPDQSTLTRRYTDEALGFIRRNADAKKPFFLYLAHTFPHVPLHVSKDFEGKSGAGLYGDVVQEMDWSVGKVLNELKARKLERDTLVIFASDNGPWLAMKERAGTAGPLRDGKATPYEGGVRVPFIARWPGRLPEGKVVEAPVLSTDMLPTLVAYAGGNLPEGLKLDGQDVAAVLKGESHRREGDMLFFRSVTLLAIRSGDWKVVFPDAKLGCETTGPVELYHISSDPGERHDLSESHPDVARRLHEKARAANREIGQASTAAKSSRSGDDE